MLYDTHAHLNFSAYKDGFIDFAKRTLAEGVIFNNVGTQKETSAEAVRIAEQFNYGVYAVVGLHPIHVLEAGNDPEEVLSAQEEHFDYAYYAQLASNPKVVGIGECGLDYYRLPANMTVEQARSLQQPVFEEQLRLAKETNKALVIHCRASKGSADAYEHLLQILAEGRPERFEVHSFTSDWRVCRGFLELGAYIGLNGIITFDRSGMLEEVIKNCPLEKIVLETDSPYLAPLPFRGKRNEPAYVRYVAAHIAKIKNLDSDQVAKITTINAKKLFNISDDNAEVQP